MTELDASTPLKMLLVGEKMGLGEGAGGTKEERFKSTSEHQDQRGEKSVCAQRGEKKS